MLLLETIEYDFPNEMIELFQQSKQNISFHINNIFKEKELKKNSTVKKYLTVQPREIGKLRKILHIII